MRMMTPDIDTAERDRLVVEHVSLVKATAHRLVRRLPSQVEVADLISIGVLGLIDAAGRYRPSTGVPFDAFARRRVHGAMLDALRSMDWAPRSLRKMRRDLDGTVARLRQELRREPADREIAAAMNLAPDAYERMLEQLRTLEIGAVRSVDDASGDGSSLLDVCLDPGEGPEVRIERAELRKHLAQAIVRLPERDRQVLAMYYQEEMTLAEIGVVLGVSESRVSQIRSLAITRLRTFFRERFAATGGMQ